MSSASSVAVANNISLYLPYVFTNYDKEYIANAFCHIGEISHIDLVEKIDNKNNYYNTVYVHFNHWHNTAEAQKFYKDVTDSSKKTHLYHDDQWYWVVLPNFAKKQVPGQRKEIINLKNPEPKPVVPKQVVSKQVVSKQVVPKPAVPKPAEEPKKETKWSTPILVPSTGKTFASIARGKEPAATKVVEPVVEPATSTVVEPATSTVVEPATSTVVEPATPPEPVLPYIPYKESELSEQELCEMADMVEESEQFLEEHDMNFVTVDERYLRCLEEEITQLVSRIQAVEFEKFNMLLEIQRLNATQSR